MLLAAERVTDMSEEQSRASTPAPPTAEGVDWGAVVDAVKNDSPGGMEELYRVFVGGIRFYLCRQLGPEELDDKVHDTFIIVVQAIKKGELREPERLMGFVRTIVRRQVAAYIDVAVQQRREQAEFDPGMPVPDVANTPEERAMEEERAKVMRQVLNELMPRDREVLTRFYIDEQSQEQICREMGLSGTQFRLLKSRAKARFGELGRKSVLKKGMMRAFFVRTLAGAQH